MTLWAIATLSMRVSRHEYLSELPFPPPGDLHDPRIEPVSLTSPAKAGGLFSTSANWEAHSYYIVIPKWLLDIKAFLSMF